MLVGLARFLGRRQVETSPSAENEEDQVGTGMLALMEQPLLDVPVAPLGGVPLGATKRPSHRCEIAYYPR